MHRPRKRSASFGCQPRTARSFLTDLRNGRSPILAMGDEDGDVQIEYGGTDSGTYPEGAQAGGTRRVTLPDNRKGTRPNGVREQTLADLGA